MSRPQARAIETVHVPHYEVMTDSESKFHDAGGKKSSRLLFCEFIDNAIEALARSRMCHGKKVGAPETKIENAD